MGTKAYFFKRKKLIFIFLLFFTNFWRKKSHFLKKLRNYSAAYRAKFYYMIGFFDNFPQGPNIFAFVENCRTFQKLNPVVCINGRIILFPETQFFDKLAFSLNMAVFMHPNGPKCLRNEQIPSLLGQDTLWVL